MCMKNVLKVLAICPRCTKGGNIFDEHDLTAGAAAVAERLSWSRVHDDTQLLADARTCWLPVSSD